jgi:hypothetical protein
VTEGQSKKHPKEKTCPIEGERRVRMTKIRIAAVT